MLRKSRELIPIIRTLRPCMIWVVTSLFTIYQMLLEMISNTMTDSLASSLHISHAQVGLLSSAFFYTFLAMQLPVGFILDRYNIRKTLSIACFGCGIGCLLFANSHHFSFALLSRMLMGAFAAFGFLGLLKISITQFSQRLFPFLVGLSQFLVMMAVSISESGAALFVHQYGWRLLMRDFGIAGIVIALCIAIFGGKIANTPSKNKINFATLKKHIALNRNFWLAGIFGFGMFSITSTFSGLWGFSYLQHVYLLSQATASHCVAMSFAGIAIGCPLMGYFTARWGNHLYLMRSTSLICMLLITLLTACPSLAPGYISIMLFLLGFFSSSFFLCFDKIIRSIPPAIEGIALSFGNILVMSSTILLQPLMGAIIDLPFTDMAAGFRTSLAMLAIVTGVAFLACLNEKRKNYTYSTEILPPQIN